MMKNASRRVKGFTLVEIMIVLVILAILAVMATSQFSGFVERAQRDICDGQKSILENLAVTECRINPLLPELVKNNPSNFFKYVKDGEDYRKGKCPCGGTYSAKVETYTEDGKDKVRIKIVCSEHDKDE